MKKWMTYGNCFSSRGFWHLIERSYWNNWKWNKRTKKEGFLSMLLVSTLYATLLGNLLSGKGMFRARYRHGKGMLGTDYRLKKIF